MALFGGERDISLFRRINRELINEFIDTQVDIVKHAIKDINENLYGEALGKQYFKNVRVGCLIEQGSTELDDTEFGVDINKALPFLSDSVGRSTSHTSFFIKATSSKTSRSNPAPLNLSGLSPDLHCIEPPEANSKRFSTSLITVFSI